MGIINPRSRVSSLSAHTATLQALMGQVDPPACSEVRDDFARSALALSALKHGYTEIAKAVSTAERHYDASGAPTLSDFFLVLGELESHLERYSRQVPNFDLHFSFEENDEGKRAALRLLVASGAWQDSSFVRIGSLASDVVDWDGDAVEFDLYVRPAWAPLCDEVEFELEEAS